MLATAAALKAVNIGMPYIEIQAHLDLTTLENSHNSADVTWQDRKRLLDKVTSSVKSIRVRCCCQSKKQKPNPNHAYS